LTTLLGSDGDAVHNQLDVQYILPTISPCNCLDTKHRFLLLKIL